MSSSTEHLAVVCVSAYSAIEQALVLQAIQTGAPEFQDAISGGQRIFNVHKAWMTLLLKFYWNLGVEKAGW